MHTQPSTRSRAAIRPRRRLGSWAPALTALWFALAPPALRAAQEAGVPDNEPEPAQDPEPTPEPTLEDLERRIEALEREREAERDALETQLDELSQRLEAAQVDAAARGQSPSLFNPAISVSSTFTGREDDRNAYVNDDPSEPRVDDRFALREAEVDFRAPVGPWADGVLTISFEQEEDEFEVGIEEGYVALRRLPWIGEAPGGLQLRAGQFRVNFNRLNQVHLHNLPQPTYPRSLQQFFGYHGLVKTGVSGQFFLPSPRDSISLQGTVEVLNGGDIPPESTAPTSELGTLGQLRSFVEMSAASTLDLGLSGWTDGRERSLYGVDLTYSWVPPTHGTWRSFILGSELFVGDFDQPGLDESPIGYHVYAQYQFDSSTYAGVRYDRSQEIDDASLETDIYGIYLTRYTSEFMRGRIGYERAQSDLALLDGRDTLFLELSFIFGAHPSEPYWVHR